MYNRYQCTFLGCQKSFSSSSHLSRHRLNHNDTLHPCHLCPKSFKRPDVLRKHIRRIHNEEPIKAVFKLSAVPKMGDSGQADDDVNVAQTQNTNHSPTIEPQESLPITRNTTSEAVSTPPLNVGSDTYSWLSDFSPLDVQESVPKIFDPNDILWLFSNDPRTSREASKTPNFPFSDSAMDLLVVAASETIVHETDLDHHVAVWEQVKSNVVEVLFGGAQKPTNILPNSQVKDFVDLDFFTARSMQRLFHLYFRIFHDHFPILHKPSFLKDPIAIPPLLMVSIITLGAFHDTDANYRTAVDLHENFRWMVFSNSDLIPPKLWILQTLTLIQAFEKMASTRKQHEMSATFHSAVVTLFRRDGSCANIGPDKDFTEINSSLEHWKFWIERELVKRCVFLLFMMDVQHAVLFGHTSIMTINEIHLDLPCDEELWRADNHMLWKKRLESRGANFNHGFLEVLRLVLNEKLLPGGLSAFAKITLLHGLLSVIWCMNHGQSDTLVSACELSAELIVEILERAIGTWAFSIMSRVPSLTTDVSRSLHRVAYMTLHTSETSILDLLTFSGSNAHTGRPLTEQDFLRAKISVEKWLATKQSASCLVHALILIHQIEYAGNYYGKDEISYTAKTDQIALRPWCIYISTIVVWAFCFFRARKLGKKLRPPKSYGTYEECFLRGEEFIVHTLRDAMVLTKNDDDKTFDEATDFAGIYYVLLVVRELLKDCRWEMMQDAHYCLGKLLGAH